jgi:hypothetical protein
MIEQSPNERPITPSTGTPRRVRLPGFIKDEDIGLGDAVKRVTYAFGIQPCGGCERRATALNRWMAFTR